MAALARIAVGALAIVSLLVGVGCSQTATSSPTAAAVKPAATPASAGKAPETAAPAPKPTTVAGAAPSAGADWKAEWDKVLAAAKKEGKVAVNGAPGDAYREAAMPFQKAYPDIKLEYTGLDGGNFSPKVLAERDAGQHLWDVYSGGSTTLITVFIPKGILDPLRPALMLPEVLDDSKWFNGLDDAWIDSGRKYVLSHEGSLSFKAFVNRDIVPESELSKFDQLLEPKWKGKIGWGDPTGTGPANGAASFLLQVKGEQWLRKLFAQDIVILKDERQLAEALVRGKYPVVMGIQASAIDMFRTAGLANNIKPLDPDSREGAALGTGRGTVALINKAPHPNAAKVYVNWILSSEGQKAFIEATNLSSRRLDAGGGDAYFRPKPGIKYIDQNKEEFVRYKTQAIDIAKEMLK